MALDPTRNTSMRATGLGVAVVIAAAVVAAAPDVASAALQSAAGGKHADGGGFTRFVQFINHLADYTIPIGGAFSVLGLIWGGLLFQAGDARAGRVLGFVALGVGIVLLSKPIAA